MAKKLYKIDTKFDLSAEESSRNTSTENKFYKNHKIIWPFAILSLIIIYFAATYLYSNLTNPLAYDVPDWIEEQLTPTDEAQSIAELKESDTDHDGLTDYQEIYQYHTSMFLEDTDSDGYSDQEEVLTGNDPLCPKGESCSLLRLITPNTKLADVVQEVNLDNNLTLQEATLAEFRKFLVDNGLSQEEVDSLSDDDLFLIFSALQDSQVAAAELDAAASPEEVRDFLLSQPNVNEDEVNALSDNDLIEIRDNLLGN